MIATEWTEGVSPDNPSGAFFFFLSSINYPGALDKVHMVKFVQVQLPFRLPTTYELVLISFIGTNR